MKKIFNFIKKNAIWLIIVLVLVVFSLNQYSENQSQRFWAIYEKSVPAVELDGVMLFYGVDAYQGKILTNPNKGAVGYGSLTGFVVFPSKSDQPRDLRQYYTIEATENYDEDGKQIFLLEEIIKMNSIAPKRFDKVLLSVETDTSTQVVLIDENGNLFKIDKRTDAVSMVDATGDITRLITNDSEYRDFMKEFLQ